MKNSQFQNLVNAYNEEQNGDNRSRWVRAAEKFFSSSSRPSVIDTLDDDVCVVLHGSTTRNISDHFSDLDFYLLVDSKACERIDEVLTTRFIDVEIDRKPGHLNVTTFDQIERVFAQPDIEIIYELQHAVAIYDPHRRFKSISQRALLPMEFRLRRALIMHNYIEMRSFNRSADNPIDRYDRLSALGSVIEVIHFAIRCARAIDGMTYPYSKWLYVAGCHSTTGSKIIPIVDEILNLIQTQPNALDGPERSNRISSLLRSLRPPIIEGAKGIGIEEDWLQQWWLFFEEKNHLFDNITWAA